MAKLCRGELLSAASTMALLLAACGDDGGTSSGSGSASDTEATTTATDTDTDGTASTSLGSMSATDTTTTTESTTDSTTDTTTDTTTTTDTDTETDTAGCVCDPGVVNGCVDEDNLNVCLDDCSGFGPVPCQDPQKCTNGACGFVLCMPGETSCADADNFQICNDQGDGWDGPMACADNEGCFNGGCLDLCLIAEQEESSIGCSFFGMKMNNYYSGVPESIIVGNTSETKTASVQLYSSPGGNEQPVGVPVNIAPGGTASFSLTGNDLENSTLTNGGAYRVESTTPVVAYQHSPIGQQYTNDASMLLPEHALKENHVVSSYPATVGSTNPSYLNVIARDDGTTVSWTPPVATLGGNGVPAVNANQTGQVTMDRFDILQVNAAGTADLSGTLVSADAPIWVVGAAECVFIPGNSFACDHIEEQMLPFDYWGEEYVGAHATTRGNEPYLWRVFGGEDGVMIDTAPAQTGFPITLNQGEWYEFFANESFMFTGDGPFLPVQYLVSQNYMAGTGDPAMYQMVPVEQFLDRYAFVTGTNYPQDYVQIIRTLGGAEVFVDGVQIMNYYTVGNFEISDHQINQGSHLAESTEPFGIIGLGYSGYTSYAYPGGMKLEVINPQ